MIPHKVRLGGKWVIWMGHVLTIDDTIIRYHGGYCAD